jgi:hypothetical protein
MTSNTLSSCTSSEVRGVAWNKDAWRTQLRAFDRLDLVGNLSRWLKFHFFSRLGPPSSCPAEHSWR